MTAPLLRLAHRVCGLILVMLMALGAAGSGAHEISMGELQLRETAPGEFVWGWTAGLRNGNGDVRPLWPEGCREDGVLLRCGAQGMAGRLGMTGVGEQYSAVLLRVQWRDGRSTVHTLTASQPEVQLFGSADDRRSAAEIGRVYLVLGVEHILGGLDHLLFVLALLFLVGFQRRLVWTITAFTLAHSVTLALSALGWLTLRPPPVEATIALSILLVAGEAMHRRATLTRRWPALVAFLFGLVHGLGFAGALAQIGLPEHQLPAALLAFNLGVEAGQLMVVLLAWGLCRVLRGWRLADRARVAALYAIGALAAFWTIGRVAALFA